MLESYSRTQCLRKKLCWETAIKQKKKKKFLSKIPSGVSLYKKIFACYQYIYYVLFQLMLWLHYGVIWSIRISKKRERNNWNKTFWGSSPQFSERIVQHPKHQIDLVFLVKPGTTHMHSRKTAWRAWEWLSHLDWSRLLQSNMKSWAQAPLGLGLYQPAAEYRDPEGKFCGYSPARGAKPWYLPKNQAQWRQKGSGYVQAHSPPTPATPISSLSPSLSPPRALASSPLCEELAPARRHRHRSPSVAPATTLLRPRLCL